MSTLLKTSLMRAHRHFYTAILLLALTVYCVLASAYAHTQPPASDEGMFSDPAVSLATNGLLASGMMDTFGGDWAGVGRHIYYMPPLHFVLLAGWYKIWGVSLYSTRLLPAAFGLVLISAWLMVFRPIYGRSSAYFALALALDASFIVPSASGRMDMECACLGFTAIAVYLTFRERRFVAAVLGAISLIVASGLTHPNGIFYLVGFLFITIRLDRQRWSWRVACIALLPFIVGGVAWGLYILQDPADFLRQFTANVHSMNRLSVIHSPLQGIYREVTVRYATAFGFESFREHPRRAIKGIMLFVYLASILCWGMSHRFRKAAPVIGPILTCAGINALLLALVDGQKRTYYMIHIIPPLNALLVAWALWVATQSRRKIAVALALGCCVCVQIALHVSRIRTDAYHGEYLPVVAFVREHMNSKTKLVFAQPEYGFELGFGPIMHHDRTFGFYSGKVADVIVTTQFQNRDLSQASDLPAPIVKHIGAVISDYDLAYNERWAQVFLAESPAGGRAGKGLPP